MDHGAVLTPHAGDPSGRRQGINAFMQLWNGSGRYPPCKTQTPGLSLRRRLGRIDGGRRVDESKVIRASPSLPLSVEADL
jgi:hypothetical protein